MTLQIQFYNKLYFDRFKNKEFLSVIKNNARSVIYLDWKSEESGILSIKTIYLLIQNLKHVSYNASNHHNDQRRN